MNRDLKARPGNRTAFNLCLALALILAGDIGANLVQTDGGAIQVTAFKLPTENGQWITADLFRPKTAAANHPVPLIVVCPGFERSKETMTSYSIELARRGMAVITIDPYSQGASSSSLQKHSASVEGYGVIPMVDYVCNSTNFDFVDKSRIGAAGYSAGGNAVLQSAARFGARQARFLRRGQTRNSAHSENKIAAIFIGGYVLSLTETTLAAVAANAGLDYARYDEGAFRNENGGADLRTAPEALRFVNSIYPEDKKISDAQIGKAYGDPANRTLRVVYNTRDIHPLMPYDPRHVAHLLEFFTAAFNLHPSLPPTNQIWPLKELCTLMALAGGFLFLVPFASILLRLPLFISLARPEPPPLPKSDRNGQILFWSAFVVSALCACFLFIPLARLTAVVFPQATAGVPTWFFPQRINNAILLWAVANGLIGIAIFFLNYWLAGKRNGVTPAMWGVQTSAIELGKTFGLGLILFASFYALLFASYGIFHVDFRCAFVSAAAAFPPKMFLVALEYLPLFFIFYLANSIRVNGAIRVAGRKEWVTMLLGALGNSAGLLLVLAIQYAHLAVTGAVYWTQEWLYTNLLLGVTPMMLLLPYFNRYFFRLTGRVYLGAITTCLIFIMMMLTGNVCYIPPGL